MNNLNELIANPSLVTVKDFPLLENLVREYPYVATYRLLYLIALKEKSPSEFENILSKYSVYFNCPEYISKYFKTVNSETSIRSFEKVSDNENNDSLESPDSSKSEVIDSENNAEIFQNESQLPKETTTEKEALVEERIPRTKEVQSQVDMSAEVDEEALVANLRKLGLDHLIPQMYEEAKIEDAQPLADEVVQEPKTTNELPQMGNEETLLSNEEVPASASLPPEELGYELAQEALEETLEFELGKDETRTEALKEEADLNIPLVEGNNEDFEKEDIESDSVETAHEIDLSNEEEVQEEISFSIETELQEEIESQKSPQNLVDELPPKEVELGKPEFDTDNSVVFSNKKTFSAWASLYSHNQENRQKEEKVDKEALIDSFIENSPKLGSIKPTKDEKVIDINSLVEDDQEISHLMTETLARLYVEQKKYPKAIEAYEILSLKNPEKSSIFADRIKELKSKTK